MLIEDYTNVLYVSGAETPTSVTIVSVSGAGKGSPLSTVSPVLRCVLVMCVSTEPVVHVRDCVRDCVPDNEG